MALQKEYVTFDILVNQRTHEVIKQETGKVENAYFVITEIKGNKGSIKLAVSVFKNSQKNYDDFLGVEEYTFKPSVSVDSPNFIKQGYEYLKTLPAYTGAVDC